MVSFTMVSMMKQNANCPFQLICDIFSDYVACDDEKKENCCIYILNELNKEDYKDCQKCINSVTCHELKSNNPVPFLESLDFFESVLTGNQHKLKQSKVNVTIHTPYIPMIEIDRRAEYLRGQINSIKKIPVIDWIAVSLKRMLSKSQNANLELEKGYKKGLHDKIQTNIPVLLYTAIPDADCRKIISQPLKFAKIIKDELKPNAITSVDGNFRVYLPIAVLLYHFWEVISADLELLSEIDIPCIGLIPPALEIVDFCIELLYKLGFTNLGVPMEEIKNEKNPSAKKEMNKYILAVNKRLELNELSKRLEYFALSCSPSRNRLFFDHYSSQPSWYRILKTPFFPFNKYIRDANWKRDIFRGLINTKKLTLF